MPIHKLIKQVKLDELFWDFDAVSLYPSAMLDEKSIYPRIETGYTYTEYMKDELVEKFNTSNFTQGIASFKMKYCNPNNSVVQHLPIKECEKKIEINRLRNGDFLDTLNSLDTPEIVKVGGKLIEIYESIFIERNSK